VKNGPKRKKKKKKAKTKMRTARYTSTEAISPRDPNPVPMISVVHHKLNRKLNIFSKIPVHSVLTKAENFTKISK
jgi:hypothetical protein